MNIKALMMTCGLAVCLLAKPVVAEPLNGADAAYVRGDYETTLRLLQPLAAQGDAKVQYHIGFLYDRGLGVKQDYAEAAKWYRKAADQGDAKSQARLGYMYWIGQGVAQDYAEAVKWLGKAADQGDASAQSNLGYMYVSGQGVTQDYAKALSRERLRCSKCGAKGVSIRRPRWNWRGYAVWPENRTSGEKSTPSSTANT